MEILHLVSMPESSPYTGGTTQYLLWRENGGGNQWCDFQCSSGHVGPCPCFSPAPPFQFCATLGKNTKHEANLPSMNGSLFYVRHGHRVVRDTTNLLFGQSCLTYH